MTTTKAPDRIVRVSLICEAPPKRPGIEFGLQDKTGRLEPGVPEPDGALRFEADLRVIRTPDGGIRLRGPIVHGPPAAPFLYLSCRAAAAPRAAWIFRLKVQLTDLDPMATGVEGRVRASGGGTVPLLGRGWTRMAAE